MNLSKIYPTEDSFEPENIIRETLKDDPVFRTSIISSAPPRQEFQRQELSQPAAAKDEANAPAQPADATSLSPVDRADAADRPAATDSPDLEPPPVSPVQPSPPAQAGIAKKEVDRLVADAYQRGIADGLQRAEEDFGTAAASLLVSCQQLDTLRETVIHNSVGEIRELVIAIAEKIIRHSLKQHDETVLLTVEEAIDRAVKSGEYVIYVHPDDFQRVADKAPEFVAAINGLNNIVVKRDPKIEPGGCLLESDNCTVDATISSQLDVICRELEKV